jgi:hypothetical protein
MAYTKLSIGFVLLHVDTEGGPDTNNPPGGGTIAPPYGPLPPGAGPDTNNPPSDGNLVPLPPGAGSDNGKP